MTNSPTYPFLWLIQHFQVAAVLHICFCTLSNISKQQPGDNSVPCKDVWQIYRDTEQTQENETPQNESSNTDNVRAPVQYRREIQPQYLKTWFFLKQCCLFPASCVFPALKTTSHFLPQLTECGRSDSSSDANSSCCYRSQRVDIRVESRTPCFQHVGNSLHITSSGRSLFRETIP